MSLYGPRIQLPKVDIPSPQNPSWNFDKEKKILLGIAAAVVIIVIAYLVLPGIINGIGDFFSHSFNPAVQVSWRNNPLNLTQGVREAQMDITITNTTKQLTPVTFTITTPSQEIIIFCPDSIFDTNAGKYVLENIAPNDTRKIPCIVRRNPQASIFTGKYTIAIDTSLGNEKTVLEVLSK